MTPHELVEEDLTIGGSDSGLPSMTKTLLGNPVIRHPASQIAGIPLKEAH
jgi:hypothetical protein